MKNIILVVALIFVTTFFCYGRDSYYKSVKDSNAGGISNMKEKAKRIKYLVESIAIGHKEIAEYAGMIADLNKQKAKEIQAMIAEFAKIPSYDKLQQHENMGFGKMYDHVPSADEVMKDLSSSAKFEDTRHSIARIQRMMKETSKLIKKMEKELKELK